MNDNLTPKSSYHGESSEDEDKWEMLPAPRDVWTRPSIHETQLFFHGIINPNYFSLRCPDDRELSVNNSPTDKEYEGDNTGVPAWIDPASPQTCYEETSNDHPGSDETYNNECSGENHDSEEIYNIEGYGENPYIEESYGTETYEENYCTEQSYEAESYEENNGINEQSFEENDDIKEEEIDREDKIGCRRRSSEWLRFPLEILKGKGVWSFAVVAAAFTGFLILGRRWYRLRTRNNNISSRDKKLAKLMFQVIGLNETFAAVREVSIVTSPIAFLGFLQAL